MDEGNKNLRGSSREGGVVRDLDTQNISKNKLYREPENKTENITTYPRSQEGFVAILLSFIIDS